MADAGLRGRAAELIGRRRECAALDRLLGGVRAGESRVLVLRGEEGAGKTALLDYLSGQASGCQVVRAAGVQSEMELAFAGLHQLCLPLLEHAGQLPEPQREALRGGRAGCRGAIGYPATWAHPGAAAELAEGPRDLPCAVLRSETRPWRGSGRGAGRDHR